MKLKMLVVAVASFPAHMRVIEARILSILPPFPPTGLRRRLLAALMTPTVALTPQI
jgi:hypothetical protein